MAEESQNERHERDRSLGLLWLVERREPLGWRLLLGSDFVLGFLGPSKTTKRAKGATQFLAAGRDEWHPSPPFVPLGFALP